MIRLCLAVGIAAVVHFVWGFLFWAILPLSKSAIKQTPNEDSITKVLAESLKESGSYFLPYPACEGGSEVDQATIDAFMKRHADGPLVNIIYRKEGEEMGSPKVFAMGYLHFVGACILAAILLKMALPNLRRYLSRVLFVFLLGVFAAFTIHLSQPIWFHYPWYFPMVSCVYEVVGWLLAGLVMGGLIKPGANAVQGNYPLASKPIAA